MKSKVDKLDVGKLVPVSVDLSKLSDVVKNDVKNNVYNAKIKNNEDKILDITNLATTTALSSVEHKIPNVSDLVKKADYDAKMSEMEKKLL